LKFSTSIWTEKLQSHFFTVTETLNSDKFMTSLPMGVKRYTYRAVQNLKSADTKKLLTIFIRPPHSRQTQTDRQTDKIQLTNTTNTKLRPKVTKCQIIHAVHFCHCA